jgi:hypothetical protein
MITRCARGLAILALLTTLSGCQEMKSLLALQQGLVAEFHTRAVQVNVNNGTTLTVTFQNSPIAQLDDSAQVDTCREVAEYVRDHYSGYAQLERINVGFAQVRQVGPLTMTNGRTPCTFRPAELGQPKHAGGDTTLTRPAA